MLHVRSVLKPALVWLALLPGVASCNGPGAAILASPAAASEIPAPADPVAAWLRAELPSPAEVPGAVSALRDAFRLPSIDPALASLSRVARAIPAMGDWIPLFEAEIRAGGGDFQGALRALDAVPRDSGIPERFGGGVLTAALEARRGPVDVTLVEEARRWAGLNPDAGERASILARLATRVEAQDRDLARRLRIEAVEAAPGSAGAVAAARALAPVLGPVGDELRERVAATLEGAGRWTLAVPLREALLAGAEPGSADARRLALARARAGAGDGAGALSTLGATSRWAETPWDAEAGAVRAHALFLTGREGEGRAALDALVRGHPTHPATAQALAARGLAVVEQDPGGARTLFLRALATGHHPPEMDAAVPALGIRLYESRRYDDALDLLAAFAREHPRAAPRQQAAFWAAIAAGRSGREAQRLELLREAWGLDPVSYYGSRASRLLGIPALPPLPAGPPILPVDGGLARELANAALRLRLHLAAPTSGSYAFELERLSAYFDRRPGGIHLLGEAMVEAGLTLQAARHARSRAALRAGEGHGGWDVRLLRIAFPFPFEEEVRAAAAAVGLDPYFVAGLIRQESLWVPDIRSHAGAVGLMQIMPATGRGLARQLGMAGFQTSHLEDPRTNLAMGTRYLADQLRRFGREADALAAYNAGPARMARWAQQPEYRDPDLWVERIPFQETRGYVRAVLLNWSLYAALYGCGAEALEFCPQPVTALAPASPRVGVIQDSEVR